MKRDIILIYTLALNALPITQAADNHDPTIVVTATRTEKSLDESPVPISVITKETILETGATRLDDILSKTAGINLLPIQGQLGQSLMMQGMDSRHVLLMIDGVPVSQTGLEINIERLNLNNVERIEIVPGASSALYGSSAMGGVINVITQTHNTDYLNIDIRSQQAEVDTQNWPTQSDVSIQHGRRLGNGFLDNSFSITQYGGVNVDNETYAQDIANGYRWNLDEGYQWKNYALQMNWTGGRLELPDVLVKGPSSANYIRHEDSNELSTSLKRTTASNEQLLQIEADWYDTHQDISTRNDDDDLKRHASSQAGQLQSHWSQEFDRHTLTYGGLLSVESLQQHKTENGERVDEVSNASRQSAEFFLQDDWAIFSTWEIVGGIRSQRDSDFGWHSAPKLASRWNAWQGDYGNLYLRSSIGAGYRVPSLKERHYEFDHSSLGYVVIGNDALKPEKSFNLQAEIGGHLAISNALLTWSVNAYRQEVSDLIETLEDTMANQTYTTHRYSNVGEATIQGVDVSAKIPFSFAHHQLLPAISYQYIDAVDDNDQQLANRPEHQITFKQRIEFALPKTPVLTLQYRMIGQQITDYESQTKADRYALWDSYLLLNFSKQWQLQFSGENLTNQYSTRNNDAKPIVGRSWSIGLKYQTN